MVTDIGKKLLLGSLAFGLFVVCPRMAGMMHVISEQGLGRP